MIRLVPGTGRVEMIEPRDRDRFPDLLDGAARVFARHYPEPTSTPHVIRMATADDPTLSVEVTVRTIPTPEAGR